MFVAAPAAAEEDPAGGETAVPAEEEAAATEEGEQEAEAAAEAPKKRMYIYGFAMLDMGYQSGQNHPDWFDVLRPTKLPAFEDEFGSVASDTRLGGGVTRVSEEAT